MSGPSQIQEYLTEALKAVKAAGSQKELNDLSVKYLGRKGLITSILKSLKDLPIEERKSIGGQANKAKGELEKAIKAAGDKFLTTITKEIIDPTLTGISHRQGAIHPITRVIDEMCHSFHGMGFTIARGPEIETDYYNFEALNFLPDHPARDMQDTFYVEGDKLVLRTHTTPVQARVLAENKPPMKIITPGKCFRNEAISTRAYCVFHQVDGFLVDVGVTMADMKGVLVAFCRDFFGEELKLRFRPSYFPFTEPSAEVDITCFLCKGRGCQLCKYAGWLEILGCGMIDPNVLKYAGHDPEKYTGYAFGIGVERIIMLKYRINDIRLFYENDIRFIRQFK
jgi:phenylalanyl-tRNA synthetase alpha chain